MHDVLNYRPDGEDGERWNHTRDRRAIMDGDWTELLLTHLEQHLVATRRQNLGRPVVTVNLLHSVASQLAVLYDREPVVSVADANEDAVDAVTQMFRIAHTWTILQRNNESTIALREGLVRIGWSDASQLPTLRVVTPDVVTVWHTPGDVNDIKVIKELRARTYTGQDGHSKTAAFFDVWSIKDDEPPYFRIETPEGEDWTEKFMERPEAYPYVLDGEPFLPWVLYHAEDSGKLWDYRKWIEIYEGTLDSGVLWSLFFHCCRDASWLQKYTVDLEVKGAKTIKTADGEMSYQAVETAPSTVLQFRTIGDKGGSAGTFASPMEPSKLAQAVVDYTQTIISHIGIHPADLERSAQAQSGYAIQLKRSAQRRLGLKFEPQFRSGDTELMWKLAAVSNLHGGTSYPTEGYSITYRPIDESIEERADEFAYWSALVQSNQMSRVDLYRRLNPGVTDEEAMERLVMIEAINKGITVGADREVQAAAAEAETEAEAALRDAAAAVGAELITGEEA